MTEATRRQALLPNADGPGPMATGGSAPRSPLGLAMTWGLGLWASWMGRGWMGWALDGRWPEPWVLRWMDVDGRPPTPPRVSATGPIRTSRTEPDISKDPEPRSTNSDSRTVFEDPQKSLF